jgi:hypothetical protein
MYAYNLTMYNRVKVIVMQSQPICDIYNPYFQDNVIRKSILYLCLMTGYYTNVEIQTNLMYLEVDPACWQATVKPTRSRIRVILMFFEIIQ